jgi:hypothetical protein
LKDDFKTIIGKTIKGVIVKNEHTTGNRSNAFLVFTDNTYYEFYSEAEIRGSGLDEGDFEQAKGYLSGRRISFECVDESLSEKPHD